jgi:hypothetical protein
LASKKTKITYKDVEHIVEYLVKVKSDQNSFDCYTSDDIGQEIRLICFRALEHFDLSRVKEEKLVNFFGRCVDNAIKNLKRDKYIRYSGPCTGECKFLHSDDTIDLQNVCKRWLRFKKGIQVKLNIRHPLNIDDLPIHDDDVDESVDWQDYKHYLINCVPDNLKKPLREFLFEDVKLKKKDREEIKEALIGLLG